MSCHFLTDVRNAHHIGQMPKQGVVRKFEVAEANVERAVGRHVVAEGEQRHGTWRGKNEARRSKEEEEIAEISSRSKQKQ